ncbi:MAG TPA: phosphatase PAP2 family protein [Chloroflexota bacterium]|nr:phosphatase PAP2 family protein [Chloroflexota bacterium]
MTRPLAIVAHQLHAGDVILALAIVLFLSGAVSAVYVTLSRRQVASLLRRYAWVSWQLGLMLMMEQGYELVRGHIQPKTDVAIINAYRIIDFEWRHGFFIESRLERNLLQYRELMTGIDLFYILSHAFVTIGVIAAICIWRRQHYTFVRNMFLITTAIALAVFYLYPTAPPRMLSNYGFVDPLVWSHLAQAGGAQPGSYTYNPYAAMPSLHVGYALIVAWGAFAAWRHWLVRVAALAYPAAMAAAVVISANHFLLDVAGAVVTVLAARGVLWLVAHAGVAAQPIMAAVRILEVYPTAAEP